MAIDIIFLLVVLYGFYLGFARGIIRTVFTVISLTIGVMLSLKLAPGATRLLETTFKNDNPLMFVAGLLLSFIAIMLVLRTISRSLEGILKTANINVVNQFIGGVVLSGVLVLLLSVLVWFADQGHMIDQETKRKSVTYQYLTEYRGQAKVIGEKLKPVFYEFWDQSVQMMDRLEQISIEQTEKSKIEDRSDELPPHDSNRR